MLVPSLVVLALAALGGELCDLAACCRAAWDAGDAGELVALARAHPHTFRSSAEDRLEACAADEELRSTWRRIEAVARELGEEPAAGPIGLLLAGAARELDARRARVLRAHELLAVAARARSERDAALAHHRGGFADCLAAGLAARAFAHRSRAHELLAELRVPALLLEDCDRALVELASFDLPDARAETLARRGQALKALHRIPEAWETLQPAVEHGRGEGRAALFLFAAHEAAWAAADLGRPRDALRLFQECERRASACGSLDELARALRSQAQIYDVLGLPEEFERLACASAAVARAAGNDQRACQAELALAERRAHRGRWRLAREHLAAADELLGRMARSEAPDDVLVRPMLEARFLQYSLQLELGERSEPVEGPLIERAERCVSEGFLLHDHARLTFALAGNDLRRGALESAARRVGSVIEIARSEGHLRYLAEALVHRASCEARTGDYEAALASFEEGLGLGRREELANLGVEVDGHFIGSRTAGAVSSVAVAIAAEAFQRTGEQRYADEALAFLDDGRARTLSRALKREGVRLLPDPACARALDRRGLARRLRAALAPGQCVLAFDLAARTAIAVDREELLLYRIPAASRLAARIDFARSALLELPDAERYRRHGGALAEALLRPAAGMLERSSELAVLADGALHELPFDLLPLLDASPARCFAELELAFTRYEVSHVVSLRSLLERATAPSERAREGSELRLLLLAYGAGEGAAHLPGPLDELRAIAAQFPAELATCAVGAEASEALLARGGAQGHELLHVAAHAWADRRSGRGAGILLAPGGGQDGCLSVPEILELSLPLELAVVSGCEAAAGADLGSEGLLSIAWSLLFAGARTIVVSAAPVEDELPARLFVPFYAALRAGHGPAAALRAARLELRREGGERSLRAMCLPFRVLRGAR